MTHDAAIAFLLGGKATFTVKNENTGNRFTYRVRKKKTQDVFFVEFLYGSDNTRNYKYIGTIFDKSRYIHSSKSGVSRDAISVKAFDYVFERLMNNKLPHYISIYHEGKCARCNRPLTVPESILSGFGPECLKRK
jgi:hypothetical protein